MTNEQLWENISVATKLDSSVEREIEIVIYSELE